MKVVSGMRPTGKLHIGHYFGVIKNWLNLQNSENKIFLLSADLHALSTSYEDKLKINDISINMVKDWISCGIEPSKANIFIQSRVSAHSELYLILNMITPIAWLQRNPSYKDLINKLKLKNLATIGFLSYPVLQAVDVLLYDATHVPVGEDQAPHIELTREIARKFNHIYDKKILTEPKTVHTQTTKIIGIDGEKMSKSYHNSIYLSDEKENINSKIKKTLTDPNRIKKTDKGNPDICIVYSYHKLFSDENTINNINEQCKKGTIGCVSCKSICSNNINQFIEPIIETRVSLKDDYIKEIIDNGSSKSKAIADKKLNEIKNIIF